MKIETLMWIHGLITLLLALCLGVLVYSIISWIVELVIINEFFGLRLPNSTPQ